MIVHRQQNYGLCQNTCKEKKKWELYPVPYFFLFSVSHFRFLKILCSVYDVLSIKQMLSISCYGYSKDNRIYILRSLRIILYVF